MIMVIENKALQVLTLEDQVKSVFVVVGTAVYRKIPSTNKAEIFMIAT